MSRLNGHLVGFESMAADFVNDGQECYDAEVEARNPSFLPAEKEENEGFGLETFRSELAKVRFLKAQRRMAKARQQRS